MSAATAFMEDLKNGPGMEPDEDVLKESGNSMKE